MFQFYWPWFALLLPLPFIFRKLFPLSGVEREREKIPTIYFPAIERLKKAFSASSQLNDGLNRSFFFLLSLAWVFLVIALMQPEKVENYRQIKNKGYDLMLAVDISGSMQAVDFSTQSKTISRLEATKEVVSKFVLGRQGDRVGLITFGENAYIYVPLTLDTLSVSKMLNDTVSGMAGNATAIGDAIGLGVKTLRERPEGSRILILLTDGEDNASAIPPIEAAKLAKQYGIRIYTIGVGKNGVVPFPNGAGGYGMARVSIDEGLLKEIAQLTGGQYFLAADQKSLEAIYEKIDQMEKTESNEALFLIKDPLYPYPLAIGMFVLLILCSCEFLQRRAADGY